MMQPLPETVRQQYLNAMGVTQWYARVPVTNGSPIDWSAEVSVQMDAASVTAPASPTDSEPNVVGSPEAGAVERPAKAPQATQALVEAVLDKTSESAGSPALAANTKAVEPPPTVQRTQGIEFGQRWWARDGWVIIDTRPSELPEGQKKAADRMLANIAQAMCGARVPEITHLIDWPLFVNRSIKHDLEEAQFYVRQKWRAMQQQTPTTRLVLLGERSEALLLPAMTETEGESGRDATKRESVRVWQQGNIQCLTGPGTNELLHLPGMKRRLWLALQAWGAADK